MKAVVLAAGQGTRMGPISDSHPKAMVRVAGCPLLEWILGRIANAGVRDFVIVTGHLGRQIEDHFADGSGRGYRIVYVRQQERNGTGGALRLCREAVGEELFFMSFGDILATRGHYPRLVDSFREAPADALLTLHWVEDPYRGAAIYVDGTHRVLRIAEKPPQGTSTTHWNNGGLFIFTPRVFEYTARLTLSPRGEYELTEAIAAMIRDGLDVRGLPLEGSRCDLSTPEDVARMEAALLQEEA